MKYPVCTTCKTLTKGYPSLASSLSISIIPLTPHALPAFPLHILSSLEYSNVHCTCGCVWLSLFRSGSWNLAHNQPSGRAWSGTGWQVSTSLEGHPCGIEITVSTTILYCPCSFRSCYVIELPRFWIHLSPRLPCTCESVYNESPILIGLALISRPMKTVVAKDISVSCTTWPTLLSYNVWRRCLTREINKCAIGVFGTCPLTELW